MNLLKLLTVICGEKTFLEAFSDMLDMDDDLYDGDPSKTQCPNIIFGLWTDKKHSEREIRRPTVPKPLTTSSHHHGCSNILHMIFNPTLLYGFQKYKVWKGVLGTPCS